MEPTAVIERYLALIADPGAGLDEIRALLLALDAGPLPAGTRMEAHSAMWFTVRDGRIARQENYDCFTAPSPP